MVADLGQVDWVEDAVTNRTSFFYDPDSGRQIAVSNALGYVVNSHFDARGQLLATWGATYPVAYDFDDFGRMSAMYTYRGTNEISSYSSIFNLQSSMDKTQWLYDEATGLLTNKLYADTNGVCYTYTPEGRLQTRAWAREIVTTYSYTNTTGEMTGIDYGDSTPAVSFTFNRLGQQVSVTDGQGSRSFTYNDDLQLASETNVNGVISRQYDWLGRNSGFTKGTDYQVGYGYSDIGRFSSLSSLVGGQSNGWTYSYLPNSDLIFGWSNGTITVVKSYEPNRSLLTSVDNRANGVTVSRFDYVNDALGRRTQRIDTGSSSATNAFAYNPKNEITNAILAADNFGYAYDPIGNRITATKNQEPENYSANQLNQYTQISDGVTNFPTYDLDGNMLTYSGWTFTWNGENRLVQASNSEHVISYSYDYQGRMFQKVVDGVTNTFIWDGFNIVAEIQPGQTNFNVWGLDLSGTIQGAGGIGGLLSVAMPSAPCAMHFPLADGNGNITEYVDTNSTVVAHREYSAFGETLALTGPKKDDFTFWFSTKPYDPLTKISHYQLRDYWAEVGRWGSRDPIGEEGAFNRYCFVLNSSADAHDPLGLICTTYIVFIHGGRTEYTSGQVQAWLTTKENAYATKTQLQKAEYDKRKGAKGKAPLPPPGALNRGDTFGFVSCHREITNKLLAGEKNPKHWTYLKGKAVVDIPVEPGLIVDMTQEIYNELLEDPTKGEGYSVKVDDKGNKYLEHKSNDGVTKITNSSLVINALRAALQAAKDEAAKYKCADDCCGADPGSVKIETVCPSKEMERLMEKSGIKGECGKTRTYDCKNRSLSPEIGF